jgi:hypothetical protein
MMNELKKMLAQAPAAGRDNMAFKKFLRKLPMAEVQQYAHQISLEVEARTDCTQCGHCCRKLEPGLQPEEIPVLAHLSGSSTEAFEQDHVLKESDLCFLKAKPCYFLQGNICKIYDQRPASCADYPHLRTGNFKYKRSIWMNYDICPIVFQTLEIMKTKTGFKPASVPESREG